MGKHEAIVIAAIAVGVIGLDALTGDDPVPSPAPVHAHRGPGPASSPDRVPQRVGFEPALEQAFLSEAALELAAIDDDLPSLLARGERSGVRDRLLQIAAEAVATGAGADLGRAVSLLGRLAVDEQDFDAAEVYFREALEIYHRIGDALAVAEVHVHLGRMHLKLRQRARIAGHAYDRLLLARWQLAAGHYEVAEENLKLAVEENLSVHRFGAAASAYETLMRLYSVRSFIAELEQAASEAARLYAAAGQREDAYAIVQALGRAGLEPWRLADLERDVDADLVRFRADVDQIALARDYHRLYHHYRAQGDDERAWSLRLKANESLRAVSKRALYRRSPDVLAVLYASLRDVERADEHLARASETFDVAGRADLALRAEDLRAELY